MTCGVLAAWLAAFAFRNVALPLSYLYRFFQLRDSQNRLLFLCLFLFTELIFLCLQASQVYLLEVLPYFLKRETEVECLYLY